VPQEGNTKHARVVRISYTLSRDTTELPASWRDTTRIYAALAHRLGVPEAEVATVVAPLFGLNVRSDQYLYKR
jgi:hypothetical protein